MFVFFFFVLAVLALPFKSKSRLEAENAALRRQLVVLRRKVQGRIQLRNNDRWFLIQLYRWFPSILQAITIVQPETLVRWHRAGFRYYWRWKADTPSGSLMFASIHSDSRNRGGGISAVSARRRTVASVVILIWICSGPTPDDPLR